MPHECTTCGRTFPDGSKEMLSGCPDCGGNKFQFSPSRDLSNGSSGSTGGAESPAAPGAGAETESGPTPDSSSRSAPTSASDSGSQTRPTSGAESGSPSSADSSEESETATSGRSARASAKRTGARATETVREWVSRKGNEDADARAEPGDSSSDDVADQSGSGSGRSLDTSDFPEWPDSARRPEDRTTAQSEPGADRSGATEARAPDHARGSTGDTSASSRTASGSSRTPIADSEDDAQADARTGVVSENDIPTGTVEGEATRARREGTREPASRSPRDQAVGEDADAAADSRAGSDGGAGEAVDPSEGRIVSEPAGDRPSIEQLREELNEQFESIKIVRPGEYELNLMELYNREEYIISLQEDGRYVIEVPDAWRDGDQ